VPLDIWYDMDHLEVVRICSLETLVVYQWSSPFDSTITSK